MRAIVVGLPRAATTITCRLLAQKFQLTDIQYLFAQLFPLLSKRYEETGRTVLDLTHKQSLVAQHVLSKDNIVVKISGTLSLDKINMDWNRFDQIVFCTRLDRLTQFKSMLYIGHHQYQGTTWGENQKNAVYDVIAQNIPQFLECDFSTDQQILDFIDAYMPLHLTLPKNLTPISQVTLTDEQLTLDATRFYERVQSMENLRTQLSNQYADCFHEVSYEMWQQDSQLVADSLSTALGVTVTSSDIENVGSGIRTFDYDQCFTNLAQVENAYHLAFGN